MLVEPSQAKQDKSKKESRRRKMELSGNMDEEILFASVAKIGAMANTFRNQVVCYPQDYFVLRPCVTYPNVANGGPPFQIDGETFAKWLQNTKTVSCHFATHIEFLQTVGELRWESKPTRAEEPTPASLAWSCGSIFDSVPSHSTDDNWCRAGQID